MIDGGTLSAMTYYGSQMVVEMTSLQGIMGRALQGNASSPQALEAGRRARPLAEQAWAMAQALYR